MNLPFPLALAINGVPYPGAKPVWVCWQLLGSNPPPPAWFTAPPIFDQGNGQYVFWWDADKFGEARGVVDWGAMMGVNRYTFVTATSESSRILAGIAKVVSLMAAQSSAQQESRP